MNSGIYPWHEAYTAATLETDPCRKRERIDEAIDAIQQRLHDDTAPLDRAERVAIMDARLELDEMKKGAGGGPIRICRSAAAPRPPHTLPGTMDT